MFEICQTCADIMSNPHRDGVTLRTRKTDGKFVCPHREVQAVSVDPELLTETVKSLTDDILFLQRIAREVAGLWSEMPQPIVEKDTARTRRLEIRRLRRENADLKADNAHLSKQNDKVNHDCIELSRKEKALIYSRQTQEIVIRNLSSRIETLQKMCDQFRDERNEARADSEYVRKLCAGTNSERAEAVEALRKIVGHANETLDRHEVGADPYRAVDAVRRIADIARAALPKTERG